MLDEGKADPWKEFARSGLVALALPAELGGHAAGNRYAWFYQRPVTLAEHQASRWIAEPLRLLDCCQESDGALAIVVTSLNRARDLRQRPAVIAAAAQGSAPGQYIMTSYYRDDLAALPEMGVVARQLWRIHGMNGIAEAVRQVRGTLVNQVPGDGRSW